jgi:hypothetical protein
MFYLSFSSELGHIGSQIPFPGSLVILCFARMILAAPNPAFFLSFSGHLIGGCRGYRG